ncbi:zinc-ribbon domain-containing protein [Blautia wexlerae]|uniref:Zinc-ribbon domain-containing protein n=1 Tax=Blautia wexlerae TaxID=418240 RepID=A0ABX2GL17_9FIRM|nr:zinc-ribbon domain-containing protein [Blautia wexlerae]NSF73053.1 zinc-ribbon domain-containing protein [Blautia wexlerae]
MGTDFFDGIVKTFSKTTKELGKTTKELGARAEQTIETQKIRGKISGEERTIEKLKADLGDIIYKRHAEGEGIDGELSVICQEIDQHFLKIREFKDSAANLRGKKICPSCEREVDLSVSFCPYCGTPCPTPEPTESVEDPVEEPVEASEEETDEKGEPAEAEAETEAAQGSAKAEEPENPENAEFQKEQSVEEKTEEAVEKTEV